MSFDFMHDTGPIDLFDPSNPEVAAIISEMTKVDDQGNLHDVKGRFTFKDKPVEYPELVKEPKVIVRGYELVPLETLSITYIEGQTNSCRIMETVMVTGGWKRTTYSDGRIVFSRIPCRSVEDVIDSSDKLYRELIKLSPEPAPVARQTAKKVTPAMIRKWGQENGFLIGDRGKLPQSLVSAYHQANG